jgi:prophage maintenance system killer protein
MGRDVCSSRRHLRNSGEMDRLIELHRKHLELEIAPEVSSAWLHHRFTQIHPFQDGNGRIARALASLVFLREGWFPLVITRDDRTRYLEALELADAGDLAPLTDQFAAKQRSAFVAALGIGREVVQESERVDQVLASIGDMFAQRDAELLQEQQAAKSTADQMKALTEARFREVAHDLEQRLGRPDQRRAFYDAAPPPDDRRDWHRAQILEATHQFGYFAGFREYSAWVRMCIVTETGRAEVVVSFHSVGREYRGVIGVVMVFFRRSESDTGGRQATDIQVLGHESFQINYKEDPAAVGSRFARWLERGLVEGLEAWRRTE